ncbi:uncharacterized protein HMPREF1541_00777 [Cyphellophora europaea CBS 101466]|uniref:Uncharacterized protein n=1 Tax=Cyphellophora europaea (strain CBS 101466) TaxID=1220924 RepID=W2SCY6_CYPE1|nr:uncharacterized protein HMPREF1541_00777 [Cyphellophora europaea CBS 101466]ETN46591.1 hypothetical protein HMPREF1541_00777 [Cyphellophora europaea CBS 101466]
MVIFGGLEIVAAGYVLHELGKDEEKGRATEEARRRRRRHDSHSHHRRDSDSRPRPPRPSQHSLAPPMMPPPRPNSAPPQQPAFQQHGPPPPGWVPGPPRPPQLQQQQHSQYQQPGPPHPQTWPNQGQPPQPRPNTQPPPQLGPNSPMYKPADFPPNPHALGPQVQLHPPQHGPPPPYQQQQQHTPPPRPGQLQSRPTMHYDTKTGKWQSNMLPPDMQRSPSAPPPQSEGRTRTQSGSNNNVLPPSRLREGRRAYSSGSWSPGSDESESESESDDADLAYGRLPGRRKRGERRWSARAEEREGQMAKVASYERQRPVQQQQQQVGPVELRAEDDWYARRREERVGSGAGPRERAGTAPPVAMMGALELDGRQRYELP